ncbi:MAG TPA: hypothetical protein PLC15_01070 [Candidatus Obscuribacter sp.]|nr:hypothetical protein [Candidatus Obscuribacter sp.]MBL8082954.1 hypothetical protein [Candidatus Obscuribacter sp.]HMW88372.1 hypothetical protein [Candidatus Obscuribacter sp.]HMX47001.1 hypothetical protein [Candidatus Obscuribacter sp.]HMY03259.1 hypothetical protein [Candidatus Obscuribacter sp.]
MNEQIAMLSPVILMVVGPVGLVVTARTLYLALRRFCKLAPAPAIAAAGIVLLLAAAMLYLVFGLDKAVFLLCIFGASEVIIMGTPLAKYHVLLKLDSAVAARVGQGNSSWGVKP